MSIKHNRKISKIKYFLLRLWVVYLRSVPGWFSVYFIYSIFFEFVINKYLLGISFPLSLAFITTCSDESSCSSGSNGTGNTSTTGVIGSDGAVGKYGKDGTITIPSADSDLGITTSTTTDIDTTLGQIISYLTVSGTDNLTTYDLNRYYDYLRTSSRAKSIPVTITQFTDGSAGSWPIETRFKATVNFTVSAIVDLKPESGYGSITHLIVYPGNIGDDVTICSSAEINDRVLVKM